MASNNNVTLKPAMLWYRGVGEDLKQSPESHTKLQGVLRGLTITQDEPESNSIDAEFFDSPFYIETTMNPITINFDWVDFTVDELVDLLGGVKTADDGWMAPDSAVSPEKCWRLDFNIGHKALTLYRGQLTATLKKDEDGALAYACTITSLVETYKDNGEDKSRLYKIEATELSEDDSEG